MFKLIKAIIAVVKSEMEMTRLLHKRITEGAISPCLTCSLWEPHVDDMCPEEIAKLNLPRIKDNCSKHLCNNGTCPKYPPTWLEGLTVQEAYNLGVIDGGNK